MSLASAVGRNGFTREPTSWLTNLPDLADAFEKWRKSVSGVEADRHVQVNSGLASTRYPVDLVESFLRGVREDLRGDEELSNVAAFSAGPSPHEDCLAEELFVDDVRGAVLETEENKQDERKSNGVVAWAFGSPSFVRTCMQKDPKQSLYVGMTPTRTTWIDQTTGLQLVVQEGHEEIRRSFCS